MSNLLKNCCNFQEGYVNPSQKYPEYFDGNIRWLRVVDLNDSYVYETSRTLSHKGFASAGKSAYMFPKDSIAISKSGTIGDLGILKNEMCGNRAIINIHVNKEKADLLYVFYLLKYKRKEIKKKAVGSIQKNLYISALETVELCHENITEQKRISLVLSTIDSKIENNNRIISELESMAKLIYDYWFVQFDFPDENGRPYKSSGGKMVWNEELKREIPEGWEVGNLEQIADITMGQSPKGESLNSSGNGVVFYQGRTDFGDRFPSTRIYTTKPTRMAKKGSVLLSVRAPVGDINIADEECCIGRGLSSIRSKLDYPSYLFYLMNYIKKYLDRFNNVGTTFGALTKDDLHSVTIIVPKDDLVDRFEQLVSPMDKQIYILAEQNKSLASLRDFLLPLLMNGQVTISEKAREIKQ